MDDNVQMAPEKTNGSEYLGAQKIPGTISYSLLVNEIGTDPWRG